jgi:hypothetical protein
MHTEFWSTNLMVRNDVGDLGTDGKIMLELDLSVSG